MAVLIDHTNFDSFLKQSTQPRSGTPDGNFYYDKVNNIIELIGADELPTFDHTSLGGGANDANQLANFEGITLRGMYNFDNQERRIDETLRGFLRGTKGVYRFAGAFNFVNGVKLDDTILGDGSSDRSKIRASGWIEFADTLNGATDIDRVYHGIVSLVDVQATTLPQYALVSNELEDTLQNASWNNFQRFGDIDEAVQVFGTGVYGDADAGTFDALLQILVVRVRSWQFNPGETTSVKTKIAEFSGFSAGYGVGETPNPANIYDLADVFGSGQISPWTGMSLEELASPQTVSGFTQSDGQYTWVLSNTEGATMQQCAAYLDALSLQGTDIDNGSNTYIGSNGRIWYTRDAGGRIVTNSNEGKGLFIDGLSTAEKQNGIFTDDNNLTKTFPFFPELQITVGAAAVADPLCWYHLYYADGAGAADFDTVGAVPVKNANGDEIKGTVSEDAIGVRLLEPYGYDTDTDAGLSAGTDKDIVVIVEGDGGVEQAITFATITRSITVPITCSPSTDSNA
ncbi:hypothetical protein GD1_105 [Paraglaciecola Antarctic GD virus 1]|nr:hypothetical protein GD1_105 [Paraglaciecola Antarctic GD virus 1]